MTPSTLIELPTPDAPIDAWRACAVLALTDASTRDALLDALRTAPSAALETVLPLLLARARGRSRAHVFTVAIELLARRAAPPGVTYCLVGLRLRGPVTERGRATQALSTGSHDAPVELAATLVREDFPRNRLVLDEVDAVRPAGDVDHAMLLASAWSTRGDVEQIRALVMARLEARGVLGPSATCLVQWLAKESRYADAAPVCMKLAAWWELAVKATARASVNDLGASETLALVLADWSKGRFERTVGVQVVRQLVLAARRGGAEASTALTAAADDLVHALGTGPQTEGDACALAALLLGRDVDGTAIGSGRWYDPAVRVRALEHTLRMAYDEARELALRDLEESTGIPAVLRPALDDLANDSSLGTVLRARARTLARASRA